MNQFRQSVQPHWRNMVSRLVRSFVAGSAPARARLVVAPARARLAVALAAASIAVAPAAPLLAKAGHSPAAPAGPEAILQKTPSAKSFARHLALLTEEPHQSGTPRNMELAGYVRDRFVEYGIEDVRFDDAPALIAYGAGAAVQILAPVSVDLRLAEEAYSFDKDSHVYGDGAVVPFHAYAADGDVTAEVVYANNGDEEDFALLSQRGIDVRGRIVVMRYSEPYSYRGYKLYLAETRGAVGAILYSDPYDDGYARGEVYPFGPWGPPSHIQQGAVIYDWLDAGGPLTFHWSRRQDGSWREGPVRSKALPRIPSLPMSWENAARILSHLGGPTAPASWQGALPFTYRIGPGPVKIRLRVDNDERVVTIRNVIGMVRGAVEPDRWVVIGNHRDAWMHGAVDPSSGTAALLEVARGLGAALRAGHRPRRTIVLANWDAEEELLGGSTGWVKSNRARLLRDGVVYINVDSAVSGPDFAGGATPALADFLVDATRDISDPGSGGSLHDAWAALSDDGRPEVMKIVGATDYTAFQENVGMSCIDMGFVGPYGVYHSQYDNYFWLSRIGDPGFKYGTTLARLWGVLTWRLADAKVLPMRYSAYARDVATYFDTVEQMRDRAAPRGRRFDAGRAAAARWLESAAAFEARLETLQAAPRPPDHAALAADGRPDDPAPPPVDLPEDAARRVNALLMAVERAMTEDEGLAGRPFFKHLIYAPLPTYREMVLPRLDLAIREQRQDDLPRLEGQLVAAFDRAADLMRQATVALQGGAESVARRGTRPSPAKCPPANAPSGSAAKHPAAPRL